MFVPCSACGALSKSPNCSECGAEFLAAGRIEDWSGLDQTASDRDQTGSDQDQTWSDHDQTASDRDQESADQDQEASDEDFAAGGDAATHAHSAQARDRSEHDRQAVSDVRDVVASERLSTADERDQTAQLRDRTAAGRGALTEPQDGRSDTGTAHEDILLRAARDRERAAADRVKAADDRARAAIERTEAAADRAASLQMRTEAEAALKQAATDELTGARTRAFGLQETARELERAQRTGADLLLAFVDVDGLKQVNDTEGHPAGDALLRLTGATLLANVRSYDVVVRYGGDEFICAMPNVSEPTARSRFEQIAAALAAIDGEHSITFGLANADPADNVEQLVARADANLLDARHLKRHRLTRAPRRLRAKP
jgi:diguanylate cyclase (GGDEF)-like protein